MSNPAWGCGPDRTNPDRGTQRRGQEAAWFRPKYGCWIAVSTCPFPSDLFDLRPVAMITGRIHFLRPAATATGRTAQSCKQFSDQNVYVTSRSMYEHGIFIEERTIGCRQISDGCEVAGRPSSSSTIFWRKRQKWERKPLRIQLQGRCMFHWIHC